MNTGLNMVYDSGTKEPGSSGSPIVKKVGKKLMIAGLHKGGDNKSHKFDMGTLFSMILRDLHGEKVQQSKWIVISRSIYAQSFLLCMHKKAN